MTAHCAMPLEREQIFVPDAANARLFRSALGSFTTGVTVVTAMGEAGPAGMTVNSFASVSLDPPLVLWSPAKSSARHRLFTTAEHFVVHVLSVEQAHLSTRFTRGGDGFEGIDYEVNDEGVPVLAGTLARFECLRSALHDAGDHTIVVGRVLRGAHRDGEPLCFSRGNFGLFTRRRDS